MATCIKVSNLTKTYGKLVAVSGVSFTVNSGEILGLLGPNGAGKTSLLLMLAGLVPPTSGSVSLFGKDIPAHWVDAAPRVGVMMDRPAFFEHLTARRNLTLLAGLSGREVNIDRALDWAGLLREGHRKVRGFSQGMRQRLALAAALLGEPELLLLDEPTNGMDPEATQEVLRLLRRLSRQAGVTIVVSSHLLHEVETLCRRVAILNQGRLLACEETEAMLSYDTSQVEVLIDVPETAARRLKDESWVETATAERGRVLVRLREGTVHQLTSFLVASGFKISGVIPRRRTLQDYFLKVLNR